MKRFEIRDKNNNVVCGLSGIPAENANLNMLIPQTPLDELPVFGKTLARDMRHNDKRLERFTIVRLEDTNEKGA